MSKEHFKCIFHGHIQKKSRRGSRENLFQHKTPARVCANDYLNWATPAIVEEAFDNFSLKEILLKID